MGVRGVGQRCDGAWAASASKTLPGDMTVVRDRFADHMAAVFVDRGGDVARDVETVNGAIGLVDTDLGGGIETVNGDITVGVGSHVKGGIRVEKPTGNWGLRMGKPKVPRIVIGPNAVVEGNLVFEREVTLHVHQSARIGNVSGATAQRYSTATPPQD